MASTTLRGSTFSDAVSYALKQLQMSHKPEQRSSMEAIYNGHDVFMWLPTGYGKSLCFQALPFLMDFKRGLVDTAKSSTVLMISPLVALMIDQVKSLRRASILEANHCCMPVGMNKLTALLLGTNSLQSLQTRLLLGQAISKVVHRNVQ